MSRTPHHNAPKRPQELKLANRYTGYLGEWFGIGQDGFRYLKRVAHRSNRRWGLKEVAEEVLDAMHGKDVPLPFERQDYVPAQPKLPTVQRWRKRPLIREAVSFPF